MFKAIKDNKIIAISDKDSVFVCLVRDAVETDETHTVADYDQYNGEYLLKSEIPLSTNDEQSEKRRQAYMVEIDPLHSQKMRRIILGTWTDEDETIYTAEVRRLSEDINNRFSYFE